MKTTTIKLSAVYSISSQTTSQIYIGSTSNIINRLNIHKHKMEKGTHPNPLIQNYYDQHGNDLVYTIMYTIDSTLSKKERIEIEKQEIKRFDEKELFNIYHQSSKTKLYLNKPNMKKGGEHYEAKTIVNTITGDEYPTITLAARAFNVSRPVLSKMLSGKQTNTTSLIYK